MILGSDGSAISFEPEELQAKIIKSCLEAGIREAWIAEDISLAVEYAICNQNNPERLFAISEINSLVIRILEETGYPEVAEKFQIDNLSVKMTVSAVPEIISNLIKTHLGVSGRKLSTLVSQVINGAKALRVEAATPELYLELARYYQGQLYDDKEIEFPIKTGPGIPKTPWLVPAAELSVIVKSSTSVLLDQKILQISGISRLFPALKINLRLMNLTEHLELTPPVTEMAVYPAFNAVASGINDIVAKAETVCEEKAKSKNVDLPVYLSVPDMSNFASEYLQSEWPESEICCREMISFLEDSLTVKPFRVTLK
jgi:hypothetical protein